MNYRKSRGLHILNIGRLCLMWRWRKAKRLAPEGLHALTNKQYETAIAKGLVAHYRKLPRANWPLNRGRHYGEGAVERALSIPFTLSAESDQ